MHASAWSRIEHWVVAPHPAGTSAGGGTPSPTFGLKPTAHQAGALYMWLWSMDVYGWFGQEMHSKAI